MPTVSTSKSQKHQRAHEWIYKMPAHRVEACLKLTILWKRCRPSSSVSPCFSSARRGRCQAVLARKRSPASAYPQGTFLVAHLAMPSLALPLQLKLQIMASLSKVLGSVLCPKGLSMYTHNIEEVIVTWKPNLEFCRGIVLVDRTKLLYRYPNFSWYKAWVET